MKEISYYEEAKQLVDSGILRLCLIIAIPRSSSTALERALSNSGEVDLQVNDPWAIYDNSSREELTYQYILGRVGELTDQQKTVLIKNIADYIPPGETFQRMVEMSKLNIFLIRNPLLSLESLMKIIADEIDSSDIVISPYSMDEYSVNMGYESWEDMKSIAIAERDYKIFEEVYKEYFPKSQEIHEDPVMRIPILKNLTDIAVNRLGYETLDKYAQFKGYKDWVSLLQCIENDHTLLGEFDDLHGQIFQCRITGWEAINEHFKYMERFGKPFTIVDSTMYRIVPEYTLKQINHLLKFSNSMLNWDGTDFEADYDGNVDYYGDVKKSKGIKPPTESPICINKLPEFIIKHILCDGGALEIYVRMLIKCLKELDNFNMIEYLQTKVGEKTIYNIDPVYSYILIKINEYLDSTQLYHYKNSLRESYPHHTIIFNRVDEIIDNHS